MTRSKIFRASSILAVALCLCFLVPASETLAAENSTNWRPVYDLVMRWLNFVILVFLLVKFGKNPLLNMLRQRREELQREIKKAEQLRNDAEAKANALRQQLDDNIVRLDQIKQKIIQQGETRKKEIIEKAQAESKILLMEAKRRIDTHILSAKNTFQAEMIDAAMKTVFEKLPQHITQADNQKFLDQYLIQISSD